MEGPGVRTAENMSHIFSLPAAACRPQPLYLASLLQPLYFSLPPSASLLQPPCRSLPPSASRPQPLALSPSLSPSLPQLAAHRTSSSVGFVNVRKGEARSQVWVIDWDAVEGAV